MKQHIKTGLLFVLIAFGIFAFTGVSLILWIKAFPDIPIWESTPIPQLLSNTTQGWFIVIFPILAIIYGVLVYGYIYHRSKKPCKP